MKRALSLCVLILTANVRLYAQQVERWVRFQHDREVLFLNAADVASSLGLKLEIVRPGQLLTFCREGDDGICIPIRLTAQNHRGDGNTLHLTAVVGKSSLRVQIVEDSGTITIRPSSSTITRLSSLGRSSDITSQSTPRDTHASYARSGIPGATV